MNYKNFFFFSLIFLAATSINYYIRLNDIPLEPKTLTASAFNFSKSVENDATNDATLDDTLSPEQDEEEEKKEQEAVDKEKDAVKKFARGSCPSSTSKNYLTLPLSREVQLDSYVPPDLIEIKPLIPTKEGRNLCMQKEAAEHLLALVKDAKESDLKIIITSAYRSKQQQKTLFDNYIATYGREPITIAPAGTSEHQLGTTIDLTSESINQASGSSSFGATAEGIWMAENGWKYGFIMSYPKGKQEITGYPPEDWHFRYVGKEIASAIHKQEITTFEYLTSLGEHPEIAHTHEDNEQEKSGITNQEIGG